MKILKANFLRSPISPKKAYSDTTVKKCLLMGLFYHPESRKCQIPFEEENCKHGLWLSVLAEVCNVDTGNHSHMLDIVLCFRSQG